MHTYANKKLKTCKIYLEKHFEYPFSKMHFWITKYFYLETLEMNIRLQTLISFAHLSVHLLQEYQNIQYFNYYRFSKISKMLTYMRKIWTISFKIIQFGRFIVILLKILHFSIKNWMKKINLIKAAEQKTAPGFRHRLFWYEVNFGFKSKSVWKL